jgi:insulysin
MYCFYIYTLSVCLGSKDTLDTIPKSNGINVRDALLKFHGQYYSSNIMGMCLLGKG